MLVPVFIVAIIAITVLLLHRAERRAKEHRRTLAALDQARAAVDVLESEISLQLEAGHFDLLHLRQIVTDYRKKIT